MIYILASVGWIVIFGTNCGVKDKKVILNIVSSGMSSLSMLHGEDMCDRSAAFGPLRVTF